MLQLGLCLRVTTRELHTCVFELLVIVEVIAGSAVRVLPVSEVLLQSFVICGSALLSAVCGSHIRPSTQ